MVEENYLPEQIFTVDENLPLPERDAVPSRFVSALCDVHTTKSPEDAFPQTHPLC